MKTSTVLLIVFSVLIIIAAIVVIALTVNSSTTNENNIQMVALKTNNNFDVQIGGQYSFMEQNIQEEIRAATDDIYKIIKNDIKIPLDIIVTKSPPSIDRNVIASAYMNDNTSIFSGGVIFIYNDYKGTLATSYKKIIMHEIIHVLGIGIHIRWRRALMRNKELNGIFFPNTLSNYNSIFGKSGFTIPLGDNFSHWREDVFGNEMMSPFINNEDLKLSTITGNSLIDLGWDIDLNSEVFEEYVPP